jgi:hypothetical protein
VAATKTAAPTRSGGADRLRLLRVSLAHGSRRRRPRGSGQATAAEAALGVVMSHQQRPALVE